jgi:DNA-directed RNA polymerase subunit RPC12/RpoP
LLDDWLVIAPLQVGCAVERGRLIPRLRPVNTLSALSAVLAAQTLFAASRSSGLTTCFNCGRLYLPSRRIEEGRRNYCPDCGRKAAVRDAQARFRKKHLK